MTVDFSNVKEFKFNDNDVSQFVINGVTVWEKPASYTQIEYLTIPVGYYIDTGVNMCSDDRFYLDFTLLDSLDTWVFGTSEYDSSENLYYHRVFLYTNKYGEGVFVVTQDNTSTNRNMFISNTWYLSLGSRYVIDWDFNSDAYSGFLINESSSWVNQSRSNLGYRPTFDTNYSIMINNHNASGEPLSKVKSVSKTNSMLLYEFKLTGSDGTVKSNIIPVSVNGVEKCYDLINNRYLELLPWS